MTRNSAGIGRGEELAALCEAAACPSQEVFEPIFNAMFPEPAKPKLFSWRWWLGSGERQRWHHAQFHFYRLSARGEWIRLAVWLCGVPQDFALTIAAAALRARQPQQPNEKD